MNFTIFDNVLWPYTPKHTSQPQDTLLPTPPTLTQLFLIYITLTYHFLGIPDLNTNLDAHLPPRQQRTYWHALIIIHLSSLLLFGVYLIFQGLGSLLHTEDWKFLVHLTILITLKFAFGYRAV